VLDTAPAPVSAFQEIGASREGRPVLGLRRGEGPAAISLIAGCHADEPVGPAMLERLAAYLLALPEEDPRLRGATWYLVPHANPDGDAVNARWAAATLPCPDHTEAEDRAYNLPLYLEQAVREPPGDDVEFGFPADAEDEDVRTENKAIADFLRPGGPFALHGSFHGMAFAAGPWFLIEEGWIDRTEGMRQRLVKQVEAMGYALHDVDRKGEKGFHRISPGFCTRPDSRAMASHFIARGEAETAALFHPSSMELVRSFGGDPLTLVSEMPLFLMPHGETSQERGGEGGSDTPPLPTGTAGRLAFFAWAQRRIAEAGAETFRREAAARGIRPMALRDQMRLQLAFLNEALAVAVEG
jgi:hypothetical protein